MSARSEPVTSYSAVERRRRDETDEILERLARNEMVDLPLCRIERVSAGASTLRLGLKRGKLLYVFRYPNHDVERDKHRNVVTRARFIKSALEHAGYRLIPWDFKKGQPPSFWDEPAAMEEEDDDLYGPSEPTTAAAALPAEPTKDAPKKESDGDSDDEPMLESGEEDEDDSDSDLEIIIDKPQNAPKPAVQQPQESKAIKIEAPPQQPATAPSQPAKTAVPALLQQPGTAYPAVRTSTIDVNADPIYPGTGKPITQVDMDADLVENSKPWRNPGADQSDYFNYGFDEFTWEVYRQRQQTVTSTIAAQKAEMSSFQQMFGAMGGPPNPQASAASNTPVPGAPTGPAAQTGGGMGGGMAMPPGGMSEDQMQMMFQQMASSGMDPSQMDFGTFMQMAGQGMGGFGGGAQQQGPGFGPGGQQGAAGRGGGGRRGRGGW